jgi:periplasmic protein CpxP/Spy
MKVGIEKLVKLMVVMVAAVFITSSVVAKDANEPNKPAHKVRPQPRDPAEMRTNQLARVLNLTKDQQATIKPIIAENISEREAVRKDKALKPPQVKEKIAEIEKATNDKIDATLTAEQKEKFKKMHEGIKGRPGHERGELKRKTPADVNSR